jgi:hypothetical protein
VKGSIRRCDTTAPGEDSRARWAMTDYGRLRYRDGPRTGRPPPEGGNVGYPLKNSAPLLRQQTGPKGLFGNVLKARVS